LNDISQFKKGIELSLKNAETWINESYLLYNQGSYGHCCALLIHGVEALAQAYICWEAFNGFIEPTSADVINAFKNHAPKFDAIFGLLVGNYALEKRITEQEDFPLDFDIDEEKALTELEKLVKNSQDFYRGIMDLRNMGIYVNYDQEKITFSSPTEIQKGLADYTINLVFVVYRSVFTILNADEEQIEQLRILREQFESQLKGK
jgi:AbiV family abortive infection protein